MSHAILNIEYYQVSSHFETPEGKDTLDIHMNEVKVVLLGKYIKILVVHDCVVLVFYLLES